METSSFYLIRHVDPDAGDTGAAKALGLGGLSAKSISWLPRNGSWSNQGEWPASAWEAEHFSDIDAAAKALVKIRDFSTSYGGELCRTKPSLGIPRFSPDQARDKPIFSDVVNDVACQNSEDWYLRHLYARIYARRAGGYAIPDSEWRLMQDACRHHDKYKDVNCRWVAYYKYLVIDWPEFCAAYNAGAKRINVALKKMREVCHRKVLRDGALGYENAKKILDSLPRPSGFVLKTNTRLLNSDRAKFEPTSPAYLARLAAWEGKIAAYMSRFSVVKATKVLRLEVQQTTCPTEFGCVGSRVLAL